MSRWFIPHLVCIGLAIALVTVRGEDVPKGIAATVNEEVITFKQVRDLSETKEKEAVARLRGTELVEKIKELRQEAINDLVNRALILQEFKATGDYVPEHFIDEQVDAVIKEHFGGDQAAFLRQLEAEGYTLKKFRDFQRDMIIIIEMRKKAIKGVAVEARQQREKEWLEELRGKAAIKVY